MSNIWRLGRPAAAELRKTFLSSSAPSVPATGLLAIQAGRLCRRHRRGRAASIGMGRGGRFVGACRRRAGGVLARSRHGLSAGQDLRSDGQPDQGQLFVRCSLRRPQERDRPHCTEPAGLQGSPGRDNPAAHRAGADEDPYRRRSARRPHPYRGRIRTQHRWGDPRHRCGGRRAAELGFIDVGDRRRDVGAKRESRGCRGADCFQRSGRRRLGGAADVFDQGDFATGQPNPTSISRTRSRRRAEPRPWSKGSCIRRRRSARSWP